MGRPVAGIERRADPCGPGQRYERGSILVTTNLPLDEWTEVFGSERLTRALLSRVPRLGLPFTKQGGSFPPGRDGKYQGLKQTRPGRRVCFVVPVSHPTWGVRDVSFHPSGE